MNELELAARMSKRGLNLCKAEGPKNKEIVLLESLAIVIPPRDVSDRTCLKKVCSWATAGVEAGIFNEWQIYRQILGYALDASQPPARNPAAVFMSILKKELNYVSGKR